jgi:hypothetical protein
VGAPKRVYPPENYEIEGLTFNHVSQILAYNDTSFCLTDGGKMFHTAQNEESLKEESKESQEAQDENEENSDIMGNNSNDIYGWGYNEDGILLTKREMKFEPYKLKIGKSSIVRIEIQHGNFIGYLVMDKYLDNESEGEESINQSAFTDSQEYREEKKDKINWDLGGGVLVNSFTGKNTVNKLNTNKSTKSDKSTTSKMTKRSRMTNLSNQHRDLAPAYDLISKIYKPLISVDEYIKKRVDKISNYNTKVDEKDEKKLNNLHDDDEDQLKEYAEDYNGKLVVSYLYRQTVTDNGEKRAIGTFSELLGHMTNYLHINLKDENKDNKTKSNFENLKELFSSFNDAK